MLFLSASPRLSAFHKNTSINTLKITVNRRTLSAWQLQHAGPVNLSILSEKWEKEWGKDWNFYVSRTYTNGKKERKEIQCDSIGIIILLPFQCFHCRCWSVSVDLNWPYCQNWTRINFQNQNQSNTFISSYRLPYVNHTSFFVLSPEMFPSDHARETTQEPVYSLSLFHFLQSFLVMLV